MLKMEREANPTQVRQYLKAIHDAMVAANDEMMKVVFYYDVDPVGWLDSVSRFCSDGKNNWDGRDFFVVSLGRNARFCSFLDLLKASFFYNIPNFSDFNAESSFSLFFSGNFPNQCFCRGSKIFWIDDLIIAMFQICNISFWINALKINILYFITRFLIHFCRLCDVENRKWPMPCLRSTIC